MKKNNNKKQPWEKNVDQKRINRRKKNIDVIVIEN